ncbi:MAG: hypothetical protein KJN73_12110 [Acidimicrobiia bacterium]|nr:hypothetical protein [Acidimicrobiia bacterium]
MHSKSLLLGALAALGEVLAFRGLTADIAVIGGTAMLLGDLSNRVTRDVAVVALVEDGQLIGAQELPIPFLEAIQDVAADLDLDSDWINAGPAGLLEFGLPDGFLERCELIRLAGLTVRVADRFDQIHFKLYAAADQGPRSKHVSDLALLHPSVDELRAAVAWCQTHDPSPGFAESVSAVIDHLGSGDDA